MVTRVGLEYSKGGVLAKRFTGHLFTRVELAVARRRHLMRIPSYQRMAVEELRRELGSLSILFTIYSQKTGPREFLPWTILYDGCTCVKAFVCPVRFEGVCGRRGLRPHRFSAVVWVYHTRTISFLTWEEIDYGWDHMGVEIAIAA